MNAMNDSKGLAKDVNQSNKKKKIRPQSSSNSNNNSSKHNSKGFQEFTTQTIVTTTVKKVVTVQKARPFSSGGATAVTNLIGDKDKQSESSGEHSAEESDRTFSLEEDEKDDQDRALGGDLGEA